tara:strand:+ start:2647 stop:3738 length:1092 start_codon:yes stop_codon:yes gene_type:complete
MKKNKKILIFGAGAIGRGFLAPKFFLKNFSISFVDINQMLVEKLKTRKKYKAAFTNQNKYKIVEVFIEDIFHLDDKYDVRKYDMVFSCVGPKQCYEIGEKLKNAKNIISCENDFKSKFILTEIANCKKVYFAIPDVITSNTAPKKLKKIDDLITVSENGILVVEKNKINFSNVATKLNSKNLQMHWNSKLFIHNAPHAILAYLGFKKKYKFIHEAMNDKMIKKIVTSAMEEISLGLVRSKLVSKKFAKYYMNKEIERFQNKLLFDPISRVAREPIRKLGSDNRIILSLRLAFLCGKIPINNLIGLKAALNFYDRNDSESVYLHNLKKTLTESEILKKISGIEEKDPISMLLKQINLNNILKKS